MPPVLRLVFDRKTTRKAQLSFFWISMPKTRGQRMTKRCLAAWLVTIFVATGYLARAQQEAANRVREKVILDTDIGDDIDDAFALALVLSSPEIELLGVSTAWGNTQVRAQIVDRLFCETGKDDSNFRRNRDHQQGPPGPCALGTGTATAGQAVRFVGGLHSRADSALSEPDHADCH